MAARPPHARTWQSFADPPPGRAHRDGYPLALGAPRLRLVVDRRAGGRRLRPAGLAALADVPDPVEAVRTRPGRCDGEKQRVVSGLNLDRKGFDPRDGLGEVGTGPVVGELDEASGGEGPFDYGECFVADDGGGPVPHGRAEAGALGRSDQGGAHMREGVPHVARRRDLRDGVDDGHERDDLVESQGEVGNVELPRIGKGDVGIGRRRLFAGVFLARIRRKIEVEGQAVPFDLHQRRVPQQAQHAFPLDPETLGQLPKARRPSGRGREKDEQSVRLNYCLSAHAAAPVAMPWPPFSCVFHALAACFVPRPTPQPVLMPALMLRPPVSNFRARAHRSAAPARQGVPAAPAIRRAARRPPKGARLSRMREAPRRCAGG